MLSVHVPCLGYLIRKTISSTLIIHTALEIKDELIIIREARPSGSDCAPHCAWPWGCGFSAGVGWFGCSRHVLAIVVCLFTARTLVAGRLVLCPAKLGIPLSLFKKK